MILISPDGYKSVKMVITATMIVINMKIKTKFFGASTGFFTKTAKPLEQKVEKLLPIWEMNRLYRGYKQAVNQNWGRVAIIVFLGQKPRFRAQKKYTSRF